MAARARATRLGLWRGRAAHARWTCRRSGIAAFVRRLAIPPAPITARSERLFDLLRAERAGIALTESFAMTPAASVSGLYFANAAHGTSPSAASAGIRWRTTQDEKAPASPKPNGGFCPTWDMNHN